MFLMFALFVVSLCTLLWAAISVGRHIRRDKRQQQSVKLRASSTMAPAEATEIEPDKRDSGKFEPAKPLGD